MLKSRVQYIIFTFCVHSAWEIRLQEIYGGKTVDWIYDHGMTYWTNIRFVPVGFIVSAISNSWLLVLLFSEVWMVVAIIKNFVEMPLLRLILVASPPLVLPQIQVILPKNFLQTCIWKWCHICEIDHLRVVHNLSRCVHSVWFTIMILLRLIHPSFGKSCLFMCLGVSAFSFS